MACSICGIRYSKPKIRQLKQDISRALTYTENRRQSKGTFIWSFFSEPTESKNTQTSMQLTPNATNPIGSHSPLRGWQCVVLHNGEQLETPPTKLRCRPVRWSDHSTLQAVNTLHGVKSPNSSKSHPSHACNLHAVHSAVNWSGRALEFESVMNGALWLVEPRGDLQIAFINGPQVPRQADPATGFWGVTGQLTERSLSLGFRLPITGDCGGWRSDIFGGKHA